MGLLTPTLSLPRLSLIRIQSSDQFEFVNFLIKKYGFEANPITLKRIRGTVSAMSSYSQCKNGYFRFTIPLKFNLIRNLEDNGICLSPKCLILRDYPLFLINKKCASHSRREIANEKSSTKETKRSS